MLKLNSDYYGAAGGSKSAGIINLSDATFHRAHTIDHERIVYGHNKTVQ